MKKLLALPLVIGLVAVPSIVSAQYLTEPDTADTTAVHQTVKHKPVVTPAVTTTTTPTVTEATSTTPTTTQTTVTVPGQTDPVPASIEGDVSGATISMADAIAQAQAVFPDKTLVKVELENEHGTVIYEFRFSDGTHMAINAVTGAVLPTKSHTKTKHDNRDNDHRKSDWGHEQGEAHRQNTNTTGGSTSSSDDSTTTPTTNG